MLNWDDEPNTQTRPATQEGPAPVNVDDKRVINGETDINQLAPFKYPWAWEYFMNANKNHWTPLDVNMAQDVHDYHHRLSVAEAAAKVPELAELRRSNENVSRLIDLSQRIEGLSRHASEIPHSRRY